MQFSETKNLTFRQAAALMFEKLGDSKVPPSSFYDGAPPHTHLPLPHCCSILLC